MTPEQLAAIARGDDPDKPKDADGREGRLCGRLSSGLG